jgi:hypothetical protein
MRHNDVKPMPKSIVRAVSIIKASVTSIPRTGFNKHGGYKYSSVDDVYAGIARKEGEVGLVVMPLELESEVVRIDKEDKDGNKVTSQWLRVVFQYVLATEEDTWTDPTCKLTRFIQVNGPQTFEAVGSYALKAFMRQLYKLPTGDLDLDSLPQDDTEDGQVLLMRPAKRKSSSAAKKDGTDDKFIEAIGKIKAHDEATSLIQYRKQEWDWWSTLPHAWRELIDNTYVDRMSDLGVRIDPENLDSFLEAAE